MAVLTDKQESFVRSIGITGMSTHRASLACIVCIYLDSQRLVQESLVGKHALQFGKGPFGIGSIGTPLLPGGLLAFLALRSFTNVCQIFQADQAVWVPINDAFGDHMIGVLLQPSLSSCYHHQTAGSRASAFFLKTLPQSRIMICFGNNGFSCMKGSLTLSSRGYSQVPHSYIHTCYLSMSLPRWVGYFYLKTDEQIELLPGFVIPQFRGTNVGILLYQGNMRGFSRVGKDDTALQRQDTDSLICLETVIMTQLVGQRWGDVLRRLVKSFVSLRCDPCLTLCGILLDFRPQRLVGSTHLTGDRTSHLSRYLVASAYLIIGAILQANLVTHLAMLKCIRADIVQGIAVRKLRLAQCLELFRHRMQFEFGCYCYLHHFCSIACLMKVVKGQGSHPTQAAIQGTPHSSPWRDRQGHPAAVLVNGDARAYPTKWITRPHIVRDAIGGEPVTMTYCVLSNLGRAFRAEVDGKDMDLEVTMQLENNLIYYDRTRKQLIQQITGAVLAGKETGKPPTEYPTRIMPWSAWSMLHPDTRVFYNPPQSLSDRLVGKMLAPILKSHYDTETNRPAFPTIKHFDARLQSYPHVSRVFWMIWYNFFPDTHLDGQESEQTVC